MEGDKEWRDRLSFWDYRLWITSPLATLVTSKRHPLFKSIHWCLKLFFSTFCAERLAGRISLYQLLSIWLHRAWPYSNQEPTAYKADAPSNRPLPPYLSSLRPHAWFLGCKPKPAYKTKDSKSMTTIIVGTLKRGQPVSSRARYRICFHNKIKSFKGTSEFFTEW